MEDPMFYCLEKRLAEIRARRDPPVDIRKELFEEIRRTQAPANMLTDYVREMFPDFSALWNFKSTFTRQLALLSFATRAFYLSKGGPGAINMIGETGALQLQDQSFTYDNEGILASSDRVPFRVTPNIVRFLGGNGVTGPFACTMVSVAQVLNDKESYIYDLMASVLRDDMVLIHARLSPTKSPMENEAILSRVSANVKLVSDRIAALCSTDGQMSATDNLIRIATASSNLCAMNPTWHPWL